MKYTSFNSRPFEVHMLAYDLIKEGATVLDLGCASGYFASELKKKKCDVVGVEKDRRSAAEAQKHCSQVVSADLEHPDKIKLPKGQFDFILLLDVIEHLREREKLLGLISQWLKPTGRLILSTPNIAHLSVRWKLLTGDFTYSRYGILDETHVHFFTKSTLLSFLSQNGFTIESLIPSADFGQIPLFGRILRRIPKGTQFAITKAVPTLLATQWVAVAKLSRE